MKTIPQKSKKNLALLLLSISVIMFFTGCASAPRPAKSGVSAPGTPPLIIVGVASYYGKEYQGKKTANGEVFDMNKLTAAHRTLPFGVNVRVTNLSNNRYVVVRINDRGPFVGNRIIDLSLAAAQQLGMVEAGLVRVRLDTIETKKSPTRASLSESDVVRIASLTMDEELASPDDDLASSEARFLAIDLSPPAAPVDSLSAE